MKCEHRYQALSSVLFVLCGGIVASNLYAEPVFQGLGALPGGSYLLSRANAVSADGTTVVGASQSANGIEAFRWTLAEGMVGLGDLAGGDFRSEAFDVSANGAVIVGGGKSASGTQEEAFRWEAGSMVGLGDLEGGSFFSTANGVSADGSVIAGAGSSSAGAQAALFSVNHAPTGLGDPGDGTFGSDALAVSGDGRTIVGHGWLGSGDNSGAFVWTAASGISGLAGLSYDPDAIGAAVDTSFDGSIVVGSQSTGNDGPQGFIWTESNGPRFIGEIIPSAMSMDAEVLVGEVFMGGNSRAALWTEGHIQFIDDIISDDLNLDATGWTLTSARDISADGTVIVGQGINPTGHPEAWILIVPEPNSLMLMWLSLIIGIHRRSMSRV